MTKYYFLLLLVGFISCKTKNSETNSKTLSDSITNEKIFITSYAVNKFEGVYSGNFDQGLITIDLNYVNGKNVSGYNLHKGVRRNINGTLVPDVHGFKFILKEPGDNPYDGIFELTIDTTKFLLTGIWTPLDVSKTKAKTLSLQKQSKRAFNYEEQLGIWVPAETYNADTTLDFSPEGTCEYKFYSKPGDSTSQIKSVRGNYVQVKDTVIIEWQKNSVTPSQKMKLVLKKKKIKGETNYEEQLLVGSGWSFAKFEGE